MKKEVYQEKLDRVVHSVLRAACSAFLCAVTLALQAEDAASDADPKSLSVPLHNIYSKTVIDAAGTVSYGVINGNGMIGVSHADAALVATNSATFGGPLHVSAGTFCTLGRNPLIEAYDCTAALPQEGMLARFDASDSSSVVLAGDGSSGIVEWKDSTGNGHDAKPIENRVLPVLRSGDLGKRPVVDFGGHQTLSTSLDRESAMMLAKDLTSAKSIFWVIGSGQGGGALMASKSTGKQVFTRGMATTRWNASAIAGSDIRDPLIHGASPALTGGAKFWLGGVQVDPTVASLSGGYDLVSTVSDVAFDALNGLGCAVAFSKDNALQPGHQQLAEVVVYDRALSDAERQQVEKYLYEKWLKGSGAVRQLDVVAKASVDVPEGAAATVESLSGRGVLTKTGAGELRVEGFGAFGGTLAPNGGTLVLGAAAEEKLVADATYPSDGLLLHLDASDANTLTVEGGCVTAWRDASGGTVTAAFGADDGISFATKNAPALRKGGMNGRDAVDMGRLGSGEYLKFSSTLSGIKTVLMAVKTSAGGGYCLSTTANQQKIPFTRGQIPVMPTLFAYACEYPILAIEDQAQWCFAWLDGKMVDPMLTGYSGGDQVLTLVPNSAVGLSADSLCFDRGSVLGAGHSGGMCYGEILVYDRVLSEAERCAAESYLRNKWIAPDRIAVLAANGEGSIRVDDDIVVERVIGSGTLTKTGAGMLTVLNKAASFTGQIVGVEGKVNFRDRGFAPTELPVAEPAFWFDPSQTKTMTVEDGNVTAMASPDGKRIATVPTGAAPKILPKALNGLDVLDMGSHLSGRNLTFGEACQNLRTLFVVWGTSPTGGHLLGNSANTSMFKRETIWWKSLFHVNASDNLKFGTIRMNGEPISHDETFRFDSSGFQLIAIETSGPVTVDNLGETEGGYGGMQYGEVIGYDRMLSPDEFDAVEAYLANKWFGRASNGYRRPGETVHGGIVVVGSQTIEVAANAVEDALWVVGDGQLVKDGGGELDIAGNTAGFAGTLSIVGGIVKYTADSPSADLTVTDGLIRDFDASAEGALTFDDQGQVTQWKDSISDHFAGPTTHAVKRYPKTATIESTGMTVVDFGAFGMWQPNLHFDEAVSPVTVFWLLGSQEGGGFLLGGKDQVYWNRGFVLGDDGTTKTYPKEAPLYSFSGAEWYATAAYNGKSYVDGVAVAADQTNVLNGDYQVVCTVCNAANQAAGFALAKVGTGQNCGGQRLGEVLFYDRALTDEERQSVERYLGAKWLGRKIVLPDRSDKMVRDAAHSGELSVSAGCVFDLNGFTHTTERLVCDGGLVKGGTLVVAGEVDLTQGGLSVDGDLILNPGVRFVVDGFHTITVTGRVTVEGGGSYGVPAGVKPSLAMQALVTGGELVNGSAVRGWTKESGAEYLQGEYHLKADKTRILYMGSDGTLILVR